MYFQEDLLAASTTLQKGGIILYPTDTIWGIGCDATNEEAVKRIYQIKQREDAKAMLTLLPDMAAIGRYVEEVPEMAYELTEVTDKPLTIIYPGAKGFAPSLLADDGSIGIRIPDEPFCQALLRKINRPIVSTSANISGERSPGSFAEISQAIIGAVDYIVKYRQDERRPAAPSSVIKLDRGNVVTIIRP